MDEDSIGIIFQLAAVVLLVGVNGFFVAAEFALVRVRRTRIDELIREGRAGARAVKRGLECKEDFIAAAQLGITIASLLLGWLAEPALARLIEPALAFMDGWANAASHTLSVVLALTIVTALHITAGEQAPKMLAIDRAEKAALLTAPPTWLFFRLFKPFIRLLSVTSTQMIRLCGLEPRPEETATLLSEEEIEMLLREREEAGLSEAGEREIIGRVFAFFDLFAAQAMIPRTEVIGIDSQATLGDLRDLAREYPFSRYPVYEGDLDEVIGVVNVRDLVPLAGVANGAMGQPVTTLMRDVARVPLTLPISEVLARMKEKRTRMVVVLDEYGGTAGIVTLGDLLRRLTGDVDETVRPGLDLEIEHLPDGTVLLSGLLLTEDIREQLGVAIEDEHNDTIGGVVFSRLGRKPEVGDEVVLEGRRFRVEALDGLRIDRLRVFPQMDQEIVEEEERPLSA